MNASKKFSKWAIGICVVLFLWIIFIYNPQHTDNKAKSITFDVAGYYAYLPALFIYNDLKNEFHYEEIQSRYPEYKKHYVRFKDPNGQYVYKYTCGLAVLYSPFFLVSHALAPSLDYPADGYSFPYQVGLYIGCAIFVLIGLLFLRWVLLQYFPDSIVGLSILILVISTNLLLYATVKATESHAALFMLQCILLYASEKLHRSPSLIWGAVIGLVIGLSALIRPTEIILILIPLLWNLNKSTGLKNRFKWLIKNKRIIFLSAICCVMVGSLQLIYWKYVSGSWIVYSYEKQGFSWLSPHIYNGLLSAEKGWLIWTPAMVFSLIGFFFLRKKVPTLFAVILVYGLTHMYITWSWDIWRYGGALGQRAMVQIYPILSIPLAALLFYVKKKPPWQFAIYSWILTFSVFNLWLCHNSFNGRLTRTSYHTSAYWKAILGKSVDTVPWDVYKLLDTDYARWNSDGDYLLLKEEDFESGTYLKCSDHIVLDGVQSFCLNNSTKITPPFTIKDADSLAGQEIRAQALVKSIGREWNLWKGQKMQIKQWRDGETVQFSNINLPRILGPYDTRKVSLETKILPSLDSIEFYILHRDASNAMIIDNMRIGLYNGNKKG